MVYAGCVDKHDILIICFPVFLHNCLTWVMDRFQVNCLLMLTTIMTCVALPSDAEVSSGGSILMAKRLV